MRRDSRLEQRGGGRGGRERAAESGPDLQASDRGDCVGRGLRRGEGEEITERKRGGVRGGRGAGGDAVHVVVGQSRWPRRLSGAGKREKRSACEQGAELHLHRSISFQG